MTRETPKNTGLVGVQASASGRIKKIDLPPEEVLRQLLEKICELADTRYWESPRANARLGSIKKLSKSSLIVLRTLLDTNEFPIPDDLRILHEETNGENEESI